MGEREQPEEGASDRVPLLTVSDINPDMLEVRYRRRRRATQKLRPLEYIPKSPYIARDSGIV